MSVYVDNVFLPGRGRHRHTTWCHLTADSSAELVAFAEQIGLDRSVIQYPGTWKEHFDVTTELRLIAVGCGAVEVSALTHVRRMLERRRD